MPESSTPTSNLPEFAGAVEFNFRVDCRFDEQRARRVVRRMLGEAGFRQGNISIAIVDDPTIHELNRRYLSHDYPTDVLSFVLDCDRGQGTIEGQIVASFDTACEVAAAYGWPAEYELLLYIIHGALHLTGMDDTTDAARMEMRRAEDHYLATAGIPRSRKEPAIDGNRP